MKFAATVVGGETNFKKTDPTAFVNTQMSLKRFRDFPETFLEPIFVLRVKFVSDIAVFFLFDISVITSLGLSVLIACEQRLFCCKCYCRYRYSSTHDVPIKMSSFFKSSAT